MIFFDTQKLLHQTNSKKSFPFEEQAVVTEHVNEVTKVPTQELLAYRIIMTCEKLFWNPIH